MTFVSKSQELSTGQTALKPDTMMESQICKQMVPVFASGMVSEKFNLDANEIEVAATLLSRDYKGMNNYGTNGVVECERIILEQSMHSNQNDS